MFQGLRGCFCVQDLGVHVASRGAIQGYRGLVNMKASTGFRVLGSAFWVSM